MRIFNFFSPESQDIMGGAAPLSYPLSPIYQESLMRKPRKV